MKINKLIVFFLIFSTAIIAKSEVQDIKIKSIDQVVDMIFPDEKIWKITGNSTKPNSDSKSSTFIAVDFIPFLSSSDYCRFTSVYFESPSWEGNKLEKSYNIKIKNKMALKINSNIKCKEIDAKDYFEIIDNVSDIRVSYALNELKKNISNIKMSESISISNVECFNNENIYMFLKSINLIEKNRNIIYILRQCDSNRENTQVIVKLDYITNKEKKYDISIMEETHDGIRSY